MLSRSDVYGLAERLGLAEHQLPAWLAASGVDEPHEGVIRALPAALGLLAALLLGLGLIFWVAAHWDGFSRMQQFGWLMAAVALPGSLAVWAGRAPLPSGARTPLAMLALLATGGLFAFFGQTYQTGADPWQLFALWAALALPMAWGARSDVVWSLWTLVLMVAISLWAQTHGEHLGLGMRRLNTPALAGALLLAWAWAPLSAWPALRRWLGTGPWTLRTAVLLATAFTLMVALAALFNDRVSWIYAAGLALMLAAVAALAHLRPFARLEVALLCIAVLAADALLIAGVARLLFDQVRNDPTLPLLVTGLFAAGVLAVSVPWVMRRVRAQPLLGDGEAPLHDAPHASSAADAAVARAVASGALPAHAPQQIEAMAAARRPWSVVLLTGLGAWLAAIPLLGFAVSLLGLVLMTNWGAYLIALFGIGGGLALLRGKASQSLFLEQMGVPLLLTGFGGLAWGLMQDLPHRSAAALLAAACLLCAALVAQSGLRALLGAGAAGLTAFALMPTDGVWLMGSAYGLWMALHGVLVMWLALAWAQDRPPLARHAHAAETVGAGWSALLLVALALAAGQAMLVGGVVGSGGGDHWRELGQSRSADAAFGAMHGLSAVLAAVAGAWLALRWPRLRHPATVVVTLGCIALAAFMPSLGAVLLIGVVCATSGRLLRAALALAAALWIVSAFYYRLQWPLADKALLMAAVGAVLWVAALWARRAALARRQALGQPGALAFVSGSAWTLHAVPLAVGVAAVAAVAAVGINEKEALIRDGQPVFVALAPADPRSLMQGDYMTLRFEMPEALRDTLDGEAAPRGERTMAWARRDAQGVLHLVQLAPAAEAAVPAGLQRIELLRKGGDWVVVTDAWHFKEGEAERWQGARFGEFRLLADGRALLVGLRGEGLKPI